MKEKYYYQGRFFNDESKFEAWVKEYSLTRVTPHSLAWSLHDLNQQIENNRHIIRKDLTNYELNEIVIKLFELYIKEVS